MDTRYPRFRVEERGAGLNQQESKQRCGWEAAGPATSESREEPAGRKLQRGQNPSGGGGDRNIQRRWLGEDPILCLHQNDSGSAGPARQKPKSQQWREGKGEPVL